MGLYLQTQVCNTDLFPLLENVCRVIISWSNSVSFGLLKRSFQKTCLFLVFFMTNFANKAICSHSWEEIGLWIFCSKIVSFRDFTRVSLILGSPVFC